MSLVILIDGVTTSGLLQAVINSTNYYSADTFALTFAMGAPPLMDALAWSETTNAYVEVTDVGGDTLRVTQIVSGTVDSLIIDPIWQTVVIEGRDLSAALVDSYRQQDFVNQTASEIVTAIANQHGLQTIVEQTTGFVGRYYGDGYTQLSLGQFSKLRSDWDLIVALARERKFDVFVRGRTLVFQSAAATESGPPMQVSPEQAITMRLERTTALSTSSTIRVQSWNSQQMVAYTGTASTAMVGSQTSVAQAASQAYLFSQVNLTSAQSDVIAEQFASELEHFRGVLNFKMLWDATTVPRSTVFLQRSGSAFDGLYRIDSVERHYNSASGSEQTVHAVAWTAP